jgi:hypothetical protein
MGSPSTSHFLSLWHTVQALQLVHVDYERSKDFFVVAVGAMLKFYIELLRAYVCFNSYSLIPDLVKIALLFTWLGVNDVSFFEPLHTPIGALIVACTFVLFFPEPKKAILPLIIGVSTHFILDFFLVHTHPTLKLLFPFSWDNWQYSLIRSDDYRMTIVAILAALLVYTISWWYEKRKKSHLQVKK